MVPLGKLRVQPDQLDLDGPVADAAVGPHDQELHQDEEELDVSWFHILSSF